MLEYVSLFKINAACNAPRCSERPTYVAIKDKTVAMLCNKHTQALRDGSLNFNSKKVGN